MTIDFYTLQDNENKINKTLVNPFTLNNVFFKAQSIDLIKPILKLSSNVNNYNYCYIRELNIYYFINNIIIENNNIKIFELYIDVLMTYKTDILNAYSMIKESENVINENNVTYENEEEKESIITYDLLNPFNENNSDVLISVNGGNIQ